MAGLDFLNDWENVQLAYIPEGWYVGTITNALFETIQSKEGTEYKVIRLTVLLEGNLDKMLSDGITPVDGQLVEYTIFLPNPDDANKPAPKGSKFPNRYYHDLYKFKRLVASFGLTKEDLIDKEYDEIAQLFLNKPASVKIRNKVSDDGTVREDASVIYGMKE